jgi:hypothetical protein
MTNMRVLLTLDLIIYKDAAGVPGILRDIWEETPAVLSEVAAALPANYRARPAATASRGGVAALGIAEQSVDRERLDRPSESGPAYCANVTGVLAIDPLEGASLLPGTIKEDVERFARYALRLDDEDRSRHAREIAGSRVTGLKVDVER